MQKLISQLISFQSDKNHPEEIKKCFDFVVRDLEKSGLKVKIYQKNGQWSLIAAKTLKKHYRFILNGHLDVVPAAYKDAFKPTVKGNRLYGRGASDMKGPNVALIQLIKDLAKNQPQADVALMLTTDEEIGGLNGVGYLIEEKGYSCDCVIIPDGGNNFELLLGEKGVLHVKIKAKGKATHGSRVWEGDNALDKLIRVYQKIRKKMPLVSKNDHWKLTLNLGILKGGEATNIVCDSALMQLDFRFPQKKQYKSLIQLIKTEITKEKNVSWEIIAEGPPLINKPNNQYFKKIQTIAQKHGQKLKLAKEPGASDGRFFSEKGIPVIMFKPICSYAHVDNEWIDLKSLDLFSQILRDFLLSF